MRAATAAAVASAEASSVSVIAFASPAVGNQALARAVQRAGWQGNFTTFLMPGAPQQSRAHAGFSDLCL